jgi:hypothetical protein
MPALDCPIPKAEWAHEVGERNGTPVSRERHAGETPTPGAGPWEAAVQKIVGFQHLGDGWDGLGAVGPSRELLESAIGLAYLLAERGVDPPQCVVVGLDGSVNLEWQDPDGNITEVEIDRPLHAEVMLVEPGKTPRFWELPTEGKIWP